MQTDVLAVLDRLAEAEARMTERPWQTRFIYRLFKACRDNQRKLGLLMAEPDNDWNDADGIAALRNAAPALIAALRACVAERNLRLEPDDDPHYFDRLYELQEAADAAIAELARVGRREGTE